MPLADVVERLLAQAEEGAGKAEALAAMARTLEAYLAERDAARRLLDEGLDKVSAELFSTERVDFSTRAEPALQIIGEATGTDMVRLYITPRRQRTLLLHHYRWARPGVEKVWEIVPGSPTMSYDYYADLLRRERLVCIRRVDVIPESAEAEWIQIHRRGIKSLIMVSAFAGDDMAGVLAAYALRNEVEFTEDQVAFTRSAARLLGHAASRYLSEMRRDEARAAMARLEKQVQESQRLESLGVLAGGIAHDFNNLLAGILGNAEVALRQADDEKLSLRIDRIRTSALRASELTNQMLAYSGRGRFQTRPIDLSALVHETADLLRSSVPRRAELELNLAASLPSVEADPPQIRQVVMNLITNAAEALREGRGRVILSTDVVRYNEPRHWGGQTLAPGSYVRVRVSDTGEGMDAETLAKIFDPFFTTKFAGRGLGLAAVQGIIRGHRGALWVESRPGVGSTFTVVLPKSDKSPSGTWQALFQPEVRFSGRALLADDEVEVLNATRALLEELGLEVQPAGDGFEAIARFERDPARYNLVMLDLTMPDVDGLQAFTRIRQLRGDVPVLLISGFDQSEVPDLGEMEGVAFAQKPFTLRALSSVLATLLPAT